jgi:quinol monooxygenase YgiN
MITFDPGTSKGDHMDEIKGIARVKFHPGKLEEWKPLTEQAMEIVRTKDSGTLQYEIFFNEDETEAMVFERYDVGALRVHRHRQRLCRLSQRRDEGRRAGDSIVDHGTTSGGASCSRGAVREIAQRHDRI